MDTTSHDYYAILGVAKNATLEEIKKQNKKLRKEHHPDKISGLKAKFMPSGDETLNKVLEEKIKEEEELFKLIGQAFDVLSDPVKRRQYDEQTIEPKIEEPKISISPKTISFGTLKDGEKKSSVFTIKNDGGPAASVDINWEKNEPDWGKLVIEPDLEKGFPIKVTVKIDTTNVSSGPKGEKILVDVDGRVHMVEVFLSVPTPVSKPTGGISMGRIAVVLFTCALFFIILAFFILFGRHAGSSQQVTILVDDYAPQPTQADAYWGFNRLNGDRGPIGDYAPLNNTKVFWGQGVVTVTLSSDSDEAGVWTSLNHHIFDCKPINFSAIFPTQVKSEYQGRITGLKIGVAKGSGTLAIDLKLGHAQCPNPYPTEEAVKWHREVALTGGRQDLTFDIPQNLGEIQTLNWYLRGRAGDSVSVNKVELIAEVPKLDAPKQAFLWNYAQLLYSWNPDTGLTRDQAYFSADEDNNISASGLQAAAAVMAYQQGFLSKNSASSIVAKTSQAFLALPIDSDTCGGSHLWPHFVDHGQIKQGTEWSSIDTVIAALSLIEARQALGLDTSAVEQVLKDINWTKLISDGYISHGYSDTCQQIPWNWDSFGLESWIVNLGYAAATGKVANFNHNPPTWNGGGFIDELAWLLMPSPDRDQWGTEWNTYSQEAADRQLAYYQCPKNQTTGNRFCQGLDALAGCSCCQNQTCFGKLGLFGLSPAEPPDLSIFPSNAKIHYLDFGICGKGSCIDGTKPVSIPASDSSIPLTVTVGHAVIVPYYAGMISSLRPTQAIALWNWLESEGLVSPLNTAESLMFTDDSSPVSGQICTHIVWNARKGGWELALPALGWGRYLSGANNPLYQAFQGNTMLMEGYRVMVNP